MDTAKQKKLEAAGFKLGSASDFLELSPDEEAIVDLRIALTALLKQRRVRQHLSQHTLAKRIGSSQSRVAKIESGDSSVSLDLLIKAFLATGATREELGKAISACPDDWAATLP